VAKPIQILTLGHSNLSFGEFAELLQTYAVSAVVDIRRFPSSRRHPHFNRQFLASALSEYGISYSWQEELGGFRELNPTAEAVNLGLSDPALRGYADHMLTAPFQATVADLLQLGSTRPVALMCAEKLPEQCHRRYLSDYLLASGATVRHLLSTAEARDHVLTPGAVVTPEKRVIYPGQPSLGFDS